MSSSEVYFLLQNYIDLEKQKLWSSDVSLDKKIEEIFLTKQSGTPTN
jgi:hypothetical protein